MTRMTDVVLPPTFEQTARAGGAAAHMRGLTDLEQTLLIAAKAALNYIANTENELGITLASADLLRAAIAKADTCTFKCCKGLAPDAECGCAIAAAKAGAL